VHQFLTTEDGRDGPKSGEDDQAFEMRRSQALAKEDHFNSEETPSTDNFLQVAAKQKLPVDDDDGDGYEYGDKEFHARDADSSDYSVHQFLTTDDGRDGPKSGDDDQAFEMRRSQALAKEDHFNSEETPSTDSFLQLNTHHRRAKVHQLPGDDDSDGYEYGDKEFHARDADSSDYSVHQFLTTDDGRDGPKSGDDDQAFEMRRSQALAKEDHFNSEETPSTDNFLQIASKHKLPVDDDSDGYEYGDKEFHARDADSSDYSVHQFLTTDDGRDGPKSGDDDQAFEMRRSQALAKEDHFNSEETPSTDSFLQLDAHHRRAKVHQLPGDDDSDGYEYGDKEFHARDADSSDYSVHQFLTTDDGRDGPKSGDDDQAFEMRRSQALAKEDHFNSEETPSTDSFLQLDTHHRRAKVHQLPGDDDSDGYEYGDKEFHARDADSSDYSVHQFLTTDDGRDGPKSSDDDQAFEMRRSQALAKEDHFNSEETPSTDSFVQLASAAQARGKGVPGDDAAADEYEYGDTSVHARDADSSDYSVHQFLSADEGRDPPKARGDDDQATAMRRAQALAKADHFGSEDTPSTE
jgi:hypothetical protein